MPPEVKIGMASLEINAKLSLEKNCREPQRATREITKRNRKPQKAIGSHREPRKPTGSHRESGRSTQSTRGHIEMHEDPTDL